MGIPLNPHGLEGKTALRIEWEGSPSIQNNPCTFAEYYISY
uniref:Uncharacterized protein n=1 Tax=Arundo donax TaxID=35708 RepID=A0A0A9GDU9_ARUDO